MFCFNFSHLINRVCLYPFPLVCWMKTDLPNNMVKWFHQGLSNTIETKMCVWDRVCEWEKTVSSISCQADGETGGDPIPPGSLFKLWFKSYSEKMKGPLTALSCFIDCCNKFALGLNPQTKEQLEWRSWDCGDTRTWERIWGEGSCSWHEVLCCPVIKLAVSESILQYGCSRTESFSLGSGLQVCPSRWTLHRSWGGAEIQFYP